MLHDEQLSINAFLVSAKWALAMLLSLWVAVPAAMQALMVLMVLDYTTGLLLAVVKKRVNSREGLYGLIRKTLTLLLVVTAHYLVQSLHLPFDFSATVASAFALNEIISITENCAEAGVPIPSTLLDVLLRARRITGRGEQADVKPRLEEK